MPTKMALWRLTESGAADAIEEESLSAEELIESAVESAPELLGMDVLIIGRQVATPSGPLDLLAIDGDGQLVVVENKRDRTPREVLAQTIDYSAYISTLGLDEVLAIYESYCARSGILDSDLVELFEEHFGEQLDALAGPPRMVVVATRLDDRTHDRVPGRAIRRSCQCRPVPTLCWRAHRENLATPRRFESFIAAERKEHRLSRPIKDLLGCVAADRA